MTNQWLCELTVDGQTMSFTNAAGPVLSQLADVVALALKARGMYADPPYVEVVVGAVRLRIQEGSRRARPSA